MNFLDLLFKGGQLLNLEHKRIFISKTVSVRDIVIPFIIRAVCITFLVFAGFYPFKALSEDKPDEAYLRYRKVEKLCEKDPLNKKCQKYYDAKYRKHADAEKQAATEKEEVIPEKDEKSYRNELKNELAAFCRKEPDAMRCRNIRP
jgi:hypothetical protein